MLTILLYAIIGGLLSTIGGLLLVLFSKNIAPFLTLLIAFAAGSFLAVSFLDLLPEAVEVLGDPHQAFYYFLLGFTVFFVLERAIMKYAHIHAETEMGNVDHHEHTESVPWLIIVGDSIHNFIDGVVIAISYLANPGLGLATTLAVAAHEIPQEIGDFAILLDRGWSKRRVILVNMCSSLLTVGGALVGYYGGMRFEGYLPYIVAAVAGIFTYIAAADLIPEIHDRAGHKSLYGITLAFVVGLTLVGYLVSITHG